MNPKNTLRLLLAAFSCLALPTQAAPTISYLGDDTTNAATWRSTGVAKNATFDVDGDNAYGTAGYALIKTTGVTHGSALTTSNWVTDLPGFVTLTASSGKIWYHEIYPDFDNPTLPIAATVGDLTATPQGYDNPSVTFTLTSNQDFVFSVITTHDLVGPGTLTLTGPGGATASVTNTTTKLGMYFFDLKGFETGDTFTLTATASGTVVGKLAAVAFDAIPDGSGYSSWASNNGASADLSADHDSDGVSNGIEYFIGGPAGTTTGFTPLPGVTNTDGTLSVTWTMGSGYAGTYPADFVVETSSTLDAASWTPAATSGTPATANTVYINGTTVTYTFPVGTPNFARLKVTGP